MKHETYSGIKPVSLHLINNSGFPELLTLNWSEKQRLGVCETQLLNIVHFCSVRVLNKCPFSMFCAALSEFLLHTVEFCLNREPKFPQCRKCKWCSTFPALLLSCWCEQVIHDVHRPPVHNRTNCSELRGPAEVKGQLPSVTPLTLVTESSHRRIAAKRLNLH